MFRINEKDIPDVLVIETDKYEDERGLLMELFKRSNFIFIDSIVQVNYSYSKKGVIRGLHYQLKPKEQGKLVTVIDGKIYDVAVDIRRGSPWYGKFVSEILVPGKMLWIPPGFAHGFQALENSHVVYFISGNDFSPPSEAGIRYDDPDIGVNWPIQNPIVSQKDLRWPSLKECKNNFEYVPHNKK
ncbi:dTDP-4-dehydrorhamnose 3,5-epimerase [Sulfolobus acidocaldarius]|uniref:dTDP-4-dehydrorhamnose 3,5-epimerase n=4 Tax=Sulfolobus acidocaldarius TaxID=2285 RepID=Q4J869_SULAC|nr:dTDP-4-dehydrorhamnose 3,5-epimerase [Sulfolobus acidocaldarius]AAY81012.1 dTDP-4-dehydrorhamnose 3,5-epimerase [Sulfolobus acidocaldarius DSM 639]AGE71617.1 dTDP-4-dehydrorhamnose 3,5-epimerase [Sulfolobus acidocaldarius N8]AGE73890.1 dTDP-4-dehydrorhamnose 3,5-epimerase [Sulfolobus acidocaldarius Ron12/I]ALU30163.1 dTDP-4-dehydrorhamnose 3,5-epimerase [Sulfolobus acidocaldarius]ALU30858.1 dTDP-4-dehydrorhamnose 3,5-epimerase [Sulfolobus acidocaldarius]